MEGNVLVGVDLVDLLSEPAVGPELVRPRPDGGVAPENPGAKESHGALADCHTVG
jgi:hypothetical protein